MGHCRYYASGSDDAIENSRHERLPRGHDGNNIFIWAVGANAIVIAKAMRDLLRDETERAFGQCMIWVMR